MPPVPASFLQAPAGAMLNFGVSLWWGVRDPARFNALIEEAKTLVAPGFYAGDNFFTWCRNNSLMGDVKFREAWSSNMMNPADQAIAWRRFLLVCSAYHCLNVEGDFVECGTYYGTGIKVIADYFGGKAFPRTFWGYDTFDYNPVEGHAFPGQEAGFFEKVKSRFEGYEQVRLIKGFIPDSFVQGVPEKIAFLHIDLNNAAAEIATLEHLFDRVSSGGIIVLDDYEWSGAYRSQKLAEDPFFEARGYKVFPIPTGQGIVLKR